MNLRVVDAVRVDATRERDACKLADPPLDDALPKIQTAEQGIRNCEGALAILVKGSRAHLAKVVKRNSSEIEVWSGSLIQVGLRTRGFLIEEWLTLWIHLNVD